MRNGEVSFWRSNPDVPSPDYPELTGDLTVDVAIVGGGLSGLWTAWALVESDPSLRVAVLEAEDIGFGASGRHGGWLSAKPVGLRGILATGNGGRDGVMAVERLLVESMYEVVQILGAETIDAHQGGWLEIARSVTEVSRLEHHLEDARNWGVGPDRLRLLSGPEVRDRIKLDGARAGLYSPDNYRVHPYKLVAAVARLAAASGVMIYTSSRVDNVRDGRLRIGAHTVRAEKGVIVATEGYSGWEAGRGRSLLPMNSSLIVTQPLTSEQWAEIGWGGVEAIRGLAHTFFYGQRTADGRIAIGGRGRPYRFASGFDRDGHVDSKTVAALSRLLKSLFPQVSLETDHAWSGVLGVTRDWSPFIDMDRQTKVTRIGGYAGQGVTASFLAARITADLVLDRETQFTALPWVRKMPRKWEPEPFRWLGANGLYKAYSMADWLEARSSSPNTAWPARIADRIAGR